MPKSDGPCTRAFKRAIQIRNENDAVTLKFRPHHNYFTDQDTENRAINNHCKWLEARRWMWRNNIKELRYEQQLRK